MRYFNFMIQTYNEVVTNELQKIVQTIFLAKKIRLYRPELFKNTFIYEYLKGFTSDE